MLATKAVISFLFGLLLTVLSLSAVASADPSAPMPNLKTQDLLDFVKTHHAFPSPYGYMPIVDGNGQPVSYQLSRFSSYIPVTIVCTASPCPTNVVATSRTVAVCYDDDTAGGKPMRPDGWCGMLGSPMLGIQLFEGYTFPEALKAEDRDMYFPGVGNPNIVLRPINPGDVIATVNVDIAVLRNLQSLFTIRFNAYNQTTSWLSGPFIDGTEQLIPGTTFVNIGSEETSGVTIQVGGAVNSGQVIHNQYSVGTTFGLKLTTSVNVGIAPLTASALAEVNMALSSTWTMGIDLSEGTQSTYTFTISSNGPTQEVMAGIYQLAYTFKISAPAFKKNILDPSNALPSPSDGYKPPGIGGLGDRVSFIIGGIAKSANMPNSEHIQLGVITYPSASAKDLFRFGAILVPLSNDTKVRDMVATVRSLP